MVERGEIMQRLAKAVPDRFEDAMTLLKFATSLAKSWKGPWRPERADNRDVQTFGYRLLQSARENPNG
jgi:hypothetical protein